MGAPEDRCYLVKHQGEWLFIPQCYGAAHAGPDGCTCQSNEDKLHHVRQKLSDEREHRQRLEDRILELSVVHRRLTAVLQMLSSPDIKLLGSLRALWTPMLRATASRTLRERERAQVRAELVEPPQIEAPEQRSQSATQFAHDTDEQGVLF